jgi:putative zinc finger protein
MRTPDEAGCGYERDDGAYVLGALSVEDRAAFEQHLPGCPDCARSVRELAGLPGLLARLPVEVVDPQEPPPAVPETLLPALVGRVRHAQRRRTWLTTGLVAAAAAIAIGAVALATVGDDGPPEAGPPAAAGPTTAASELMQPVGAEAISGWVSLTQLGWGTRVDLTCSYAAEGEAYEDGAPTYTMYVTRTDGSTEQVASWRGLPGKTMHLAAATAADADDVASVEIRDRDGDPVLELDG